ncbi:hypothetical protein BKA58DRAFT_427908 [Alternaria rosae]|uniref:uncharacterized protein n=1 Tax=Alternaria rosae TaxID=1187941 RepID=UPI001E8DB05D|nr:uncharacterized protein BKA58DRAFT_427908 [Alternaria rosae]KAH6875309.1 hypothetical protein BKA58DRAFT_427908 [Alternaria rosae]
MAPTIHIIDPDPDTVIVLKNPCKIFAPWDPEEERRNPTMSEVPYSDEHPQPSTSRPHQEPALVETPADSSMYTLDEGSTALTEPSSAVQRTPSPDLPEEPEEESIHYHVSSRHLILASVAFKRMLAQNGFAESVRNEADGLYHITAHDWDAEAFLIVLRIVHGRNKQVPREVSLEMLAKIAVLEDYYNFEEALDVFTEVWILELTKRPIPQMHCRDLVLWVWIAWVFDIEQQFTKATATSIRQITESFRTLDLPIPAIVSDEIDARRYLAIESLLEGLQERLEMYRRTDYTCLCDSHMSFQCGSYLLGSLMKELCRLGLDQPRPEIPFRDLSFSALCGQPYMI